MDQLTLLKFHPSLIHLRLAQEGDVIAYLLLKLSSNWTAELSPYHVGKVSSFNCESS
nr:coilin-like isoform X4 [Ipomoea batatas]